MLWSKYILTQSFKFNSVGVLLINATWLYDIEVCKSVFKNNFFAIESGSNPFWQQITILKPFLLLSSLRLSIPSSSFVSQSLPMSAISVSVWTP